MPTFPIVIQYYDEDQKQAIQNNYPIDFAQIDRRIGKVNLSFEDLQVYSLFRHQTAHSGYSTFNDFLPVAERHWGENNLYFELRSDSGNLVCKYPAQLAAPNVPESMGVGGGLLVFGHLYGLHQADWKRIRTKPVKDLDFTRASSIKGRTLNVELKGSIVDNSEGKTSSISVHKAKILQKKEAVKARQEYDSEVDTCLSSIVVVSKADEPVICYLLDPPSDETTPEPGKNRLLRRLYYYGEMLNWISPRSMLSNILVNRIRAIEVSTSHEDFNGLELVHRLIINRTQFSFGILLSA